MGAVDIRLAGLPIVASGVLISPTVLVPAGHVTRFFDLAGQTKARVTFDPVVSDSSTWHWGTVHTDPAFTNAEPDPNDLGVIVFDAPIPGITPALLPTENFLDQLQGKGVLVIFEGVGYGVSQHVGGANDQGLGAFTGDGTRKYLHSQFHVSYQGWLQTFPIDGEICFGDSGGPTLLGILAVGIQKTGVNALCNGGDANMRLDTPEHRAFLGQFVTLP